MEYGFLSVLPPLIAILLALYTKDVFIALFTGCFSGYFILSDLKIISGLDATFMSFIQVFADADNTIVIISVLLIGALIHLIEQSGGINGFVESMVRHRGIITTKRTANMFTWFTGLLVFTSGTLSTLLTGAITRPVNDALKVPHEKSSFIVHSTSTPVCVLIPLSGWGAFMIGLIQAQGIPDATQVMIQSIPLNLYAILAVFFLPILIYTGFDFKVMKKAENRADTTGMLDADLDRQNLMESENRNMTPSPVKNLIIPIVTMVCVILAGLFITGKGSLIEGDGMRSILWGCIVSLLTSYILYRSQGIFHYKAFMKHLFYGAGSMLNVGSILIFAFSMGSVVKMLGTGPYLAEVFAGFLTPALLPALIFLFSCIISFSTGSSMGTMAVMMPVAMPMALTMDMSVALISASVFGGSIFGDHASPISDTTIMSCTTTGCDVMDHIRTQLPYVVSYAALALLGYLILGFSGI
ncbi:TPA: sodium:solute symporter [Candidatus Marinimicrobia bacterium]|nr:MAG: Na+/H+ antiporter family protein [Marinimicrobia bacterium 46_47]KUK91753.1 MAG: Na+/H+ antiporter NhaC-like protein [Marinimicrobia bacterium 46_43]HAE86479.1 sodium:solute symporter [Candidatus Neomarinimicrobiota bacterium]HBY18364.1 sodium:solute symporter [Candidatus Neomarinimicrobiota bacterium]